jgi:nucleotide-binding universal stress UspA family protein
MARTGFRVVVAIDASKTGRAAVAATLRFSWPAGAEVSGVMARRTRAAAGRPRYVVDAFDRAFRQGAAQARRRLAARWPDARVTVVDKTPVEAILDEIRRVGARVVVVGRRRQGTIRRLLLGSTSRAVVRRAPCSVLVVNRVPRRFRRFVVALDGSVNARRAAALVAALAPGSAGSAMLVTVLEPQSPPPYALLPTIQRSRVRDELAQVKVEAATTARRHLDAAATALREAGWRTTTVLRSGSPLEVLMATVQETGADALVMGARGVGALERLRVGSVAEAALSQCPVPVLLVR